MKKINRLIIFLMAAIIGTAAVSCKKDNTIQYNNATMGNIVDGRFVSDQGNTFNIVDQQCLGKLDTMKRAFIVCDVLNRTPGGSSTEYDIRLNQIATVLTKDPVLHTNTTAEMLIQDPVHIEYAWISGGYINLYVMFPIKVGSTEKHLINLVHEGGMIDPATEKEIEGTYRFTLRHNSNGDKITPPQVVDYALAGGYVSFPLNSYITEKEADFCIEWTWHKNVGDGLSSETEVRTMKAKYTSDGYQHAPSQQSYSVRTTAIVE